MTGLCLASGVMPASAWVFKIEQTLVQRLVEWFGSRNVEVEIAFN